MFFLLNILFLLSISFLLIHSLDNVILSVSHSFTLPRFPPYRFFDHPLIPPKLMFPSILFLKIKNNKRHGKQSKIEAANLNGICPAK